MPVQKGRIVHKEDSIKGRGGGGIVQKDITEGRAGADGGYYKREGWCRRTL